MKKGEPSVERQPGDIPLDAKPSDLAKVLVVDDLEDVRWVLSNLVRQAGFVPLVAASGQEALTCIQQEAPDVVLLDVGLPDMDGFEVLKRVKAHDKAVSVIMVTANGKTEDAVRAMRAGAVDYVGKPFSNADIILTMRRALEESALKRQHRQLLIQPQGPADSLLDCMGKSAAIRRIQKEVESVAKTNFSVLVTGESGTGKELVSQAIHARSRRTAKPFIAVDCGAIAESLIENELFGHEKGAFTGAHQAQAGAFELANGGTIFLDEIGNLPLAMQGKLLRVLETRRIHRIGGTSEQEVDFRVVTATNADLLAMVEQKLFRGDLYHRLAEYAISVPPLREREDDLAFLVNRFLDQTNQELGKQVQGLSGTAWGLVQAHHWPGNARELRNQLRRAVLLCDDPEGMISPEYLGMLDRRRSPSLSVGLDRRRSPSLSVGLDQAEQCRSGNGVHKACPLCDSMALLASGDDLSLKELSTRMTAQMERAILLQVLALTNGNKAHAARKLQIDYKTILNKLKAYEISSVPFMTDAYQDEGR